jgi:hypothetical protein
MLRATERTVAKKSTAELLRDEELALFSNVE